MKARTRYMRMFDKLPLEARRNLVFNAYGDNPMSLFAIYWEVRQETEVGKLCLINLGYIDDANVGVSEQ